VVEPAVLVPDAPAAADDVPVRPGPAPLRGGVLDLVRFLRSKRMLGPGYLLLLARLAYFKLRYRGRLTTDGIAFITPGVRFEIGPGAHVHLGRWSWLGQGCKVRVHEGRFEVGAKTVLGQECTVSCYQRVTIGRECILADRCMLIDFDHGAAEAERPVREQGIYKQDVEVGSNVWMGYGACVLRGTTVGDNAIIGTSAVVTKDVPANGVVGGVPAKLLRVRPAPRTLRWR
jgi:acetyltransferase-like isoleucine patch superfamily enzyme